MDSRNRFLQPEAVGKPEQVVALLAPVTSVIIAGSLVRLSIQPAMEGQVQSVTPAIST